MRFNFLARIYASGTKSSVIKNAYSNLLGVILSMLKYISSAWKAPCGAVSIRKTVLPGMAIPMLKIRRPNGRLIFNMEIAIRR